MKMAWWLLGITLPYVQAASADAPSFSKDILPTLKSRCAICHLTGNEAGNLALASGAYKNLTAGMSHEAPLKLVEPRDPDRSYLVMKLEGTHLDHGGKGARMPFGDTPLDADVIGLIRKWIAAGAPDN